jgi:Nuclear fragile X mental retardation-interacting protein 1 (NUFIP1)
MRPDRYAALVQQVAQWRAERRRCWPSKQNVERKEETGGVCMYTLYVHYMYVHTVLVAMSSMQCSSGRV